jgi:polyphosphate kinase
MLFDYLQSRKQPADYGKINFGHLLVSQFNMIDRFSEMIDREIELAKKGRPASIIIKMNNLQEKEMISKLYEASQAGVRVQLLVRSICCLAPGIRGQSENIEVRRIVDRYLEHARVFVFNNDGQPEFYMGSADWMNRNLHSRIEVCFPLYNKELCNEIFHILDLQLRDNVKAVRVDADLNNIYLEGMPPVAAQAAIYDYVKKLSGYRESVQASPVYA